NIVATAQGLGRQETLTFHPAAPGHYQLQVRSLDHAARFVLDLAGGLPLPARAPGVAWAQPLSGDTQGASLPVRAAVAGTDVQSVTADLDGESLSVALAPEPGNCFWAATLDLDGLPEGDHPLRVTAA